MVKHCTPRATGMVACRLPREDLTQLLAEHSQHNLEGITVSCFNSPRDAVLAGPLTSLANLIKLCKERGIWNKLLDVPYGFHSPAMDPILDGLAQLGTSSSTVFRAPSSGLLVGSSLLGRLFGASETVNADYFVRHAREPVDFCGVMENAMQVLSENYPVFMEIGPSPSSKCLS